MVLSDLRIGQCARILRVNGGGELRRRLLDMGLTPNTIVKLVRVAPLGDPIELCLRGYNLSLREEAARDIEVELLQVGSVSCGRACQIHGFRNCTECAFLEERAEADASCPGFVQENEMDENVRSSESSQDHPLRKKRKRRRWLRNR